MVHKNEEWKVGVTHAIKITLRGSGPQLSAQEESIEAARINVHLILCNLQNKVGVKNLAG